MADRTVALNIKVKDAEVKQAEASLKRLQDAANNVSKSGGGLKGADQDGAIAAAAKRVGISYEQMAARMKGVTGVSKEAAVAISDVSAAASAAVPDVAAAAESLGGLGAAAGPVGIAIAVIVAAVTAAVAVAVKLTKKAFELAKAFADYTVEIGKAAEETGLAAETVSALRYECEAAGRDFGTISSAANNFRTQIGKAAAGNNEARKSVNLLGLDGKKAMTDIDGAFRSAIATISAAKNPVDQMRLAIAAFGDEGPQMIAFIREFGGDIGKLEEKASELGLTVSGKNVAAAKEFQRAYADVQKQVQSVGMAFGRELMPIVAQAMRELGDWVGRNKATITDWAQTTANFARGVIEEFKEIIEFVEQHPILTRILLGVATLGQSEFIKDGVDRVLNAAGVIAQKGAGTQGTINYDRPSATNSNSVDLQALAAQQEELQRRHAELRKLAERDLNAAIEYEKNAASIVITSFNKLFETIKDRFEKSGDVDAFNSQIDSIVTQYIHHITTVENFLMRLENRKAAADKLTPNEKAVLKQDQSSRRDEWTSKYVDVRNHAVDAIASYEKKSSADALKSRESEMQREIELYNEMNQTKMQIARQSHEMTITSERQMIDEINRLEMDTLGHRKAALQSYLTALTGNAEKEADVKHQIALVDEQITQQQITNSNRVREMESRKQETLNKIREQYEGVRRSMEDELAVLLRGGVGLSRYEQALRAVSREYKDWSAEQKQAIIDLAAQADAVEELNKRHAELKDFFNQTLTYVFEGDFKGLFENMRRKILGAFTEKLSGILATNILGFDPNATDNPVAKPIVGKIDKTNQILTAINTRLGGSPVAGIGGLGGLASIFSGGLGHENAHLATGQSTATGAGSLGQEGGSGHQIMNLSGLWKDLKKIFSTGEGGIFAPVNGSSMAGYISGAGAIASMVGGMVGGRLGSTLSMAGQGAQIGAQFGGPWGALIGAAAGGLLGFFGFSDPKRKEDKQQNLPALNQGFTDAMKELNEILSGVRSLSLDPDEAISRANDLRGQIASGFGIEFKSKKYKKQAQQLIASKLVEADRIVDEIKAAAEIARGAADRSKRILPEFAGGHYFADYFRPNGLVPGAFDGADNILAMISRGEMVLNPRQQSRVRSLAGYDVFASAGIPNYPKASASPRLAMGGIAGTGLALSNTPTVLAPNFNLYLAGVTFYDQAQAWVESDDGKRAIVKLIVDKDKGKV